MTEAGTTSTGSGAGNTPGRPVRVRRATLADVPALVRMRALMLTDMGMDVGDDRAPWRAASAQWFADRVPRSEEFAAFLVDDPELGVVACAVGACDAHAPSPANPSGLHGHVSNVSTDPRRRRLGHARACLDALLIWFRQETRATVVGLNATGEGAGLYESFGFAPPRHPSLQLRTASRSS
ncbi:MULTISPECIES: GNAT family N-acetyltransferase [unclassified Streptomyces]|uniref:GNAT family N-acetyltransferase n=1 Tax=unclassified Streptomyces TaxID=2593676 RepID=UPI0020338FB2|nr:GNAT family N-acetyltransferase [Streptomyces sp. RKAG290]MCM2416053.1 GNAT family N-acetyltransferase [Streptomyces sp. RKAG290]